MKEIMLEIEDYRDGYPIVITRIAPAPAPDLSDQIKIVDCGPGMSLWRIRTGPGEHRDALIITLDAYTSDQGAGRPTPYLCVKCGHTWRPRAKKGIAKPRACPGCKNYKWDA